MIKKFGFWIAAILMFALQSCSVNSETTYYKDSATSMESHILMDQSMMGVLNMMGDQSAVIKKETAGEFKNITTDWKSLYDIQKNGKIVVNQDSAKVLKKMFMKLNKSNGEILGLSLKYDKLLPKELASLFAQSRQLRNVPLQNATQWNGNQLTINTDKFNVTEMLQDLQKIKTDDSQKPKNKKDSIEAYGKQMASGMVGMMKMVNMNFTNTLKFQKPIKTIVGKHDFVEQVDKNTVRINVRTADLWDEGKNLKNKDKKIIITTE